MNGFLKVFFVFLIPVLASTYAQSQVFTQSAPEPRTMPEKSGDFTPYPKAEAQVIKKGLLAPGENDIATHLFLLSQPETGLIRLLPRELYDWEMYKVEKKLEMRGGGAFFSFHYRAHAYGYGSDLSLERSELFVGFAGADYGILADLGNVELEQFYVNDPRAAFLLNYQPPTKESEIRLESQRFYPNIIVDGITYRKRMKSEVGHTYLLRSFVFDRSDVLVALRVDRQDDDGSVIIAWKLLKEYKAPKLLREQAINNPTTNWNLSGADQR